MPETPKQFGQISPPSGSYSTTPGGFGNHPSSYAPISTPTPDSIRYLPPDYIRSLAPDYPQSQFLGGTKNDTEKLDRFDLIPPEALVALAEVYGIGSRKYGDRNWERGMSWGRIFRAMISHAFKWWRGETYDPVDGQHHLSSVAWGAFTLFAYETRKAGKDDRAIV